MRINDPLLMTNHSKKLSFLSFRNFLYSKNIRNLELSGGWIPGQARNDRRKSFTLIELLVVLALVAILSVVVILTLNPAELIKQARDSNRLSDLSTINTALNLFSSDVVNGFMGTSTVVYVSIPDSSATCTNLGLPSLPSGYTYNCVTSSNLRNTNGTGWIPVNFERISSNSPISQLPIDPINTTSTNLYYTYVAGGSWELSANIEASRNKLGGSGDIVSKDGGSAPSSYELGNNLNLNPIETGDSSLILSYKFNEGSGQILIDRSGYGHNGQLGLTSGVDSTDPTWTTSGLSFDGVNDYATSSVFTLNQPSTIIVWAQSQSPSQYFLYDSQNCSNRQGLYMDSAQVRSFAGANLGYSHGYQFSRTMFASIYNGASSQIFESGVLVATGNPGSQNITTGITIGAACTKGVPMTGIISGLTIYNRALSSAEILALYNANK